MKINFKIVSLLLFTVIVFGQKNEIKEAQKEFKDGNFQQTVSILSPIEYLISNADNEEREHFYFLMGSSTLELANRNIDTSKNLSRAALAFNDLILVEQELGKLKYTTQAITSLVQIKKDFIKGANEDLALENFTESSGKFYQAYLLDKKDTIQLYNAALSYKSASSNALALKCFDELKTLNFSGEYPVYIAYSKEKKADEILSSVEERDSKIKLGTHLNPKIEIRSKKSEMYRNIALIYVENGYKEKAIKAIELAKKYNPENYSLAFMEANLYLETKDYEFFDKLANAFIEKNPKNAEVASNFGLSCLNEKYYEGAEYFFKKAIKIDPGYANAYVNLSTLLIEKGMLVTEKINELGSSTSDKKRYEALKVQRESMMKSVVPYLQKGVSLDPYNDQAILLLSSLNNVINFQTHSKALASEE